MAVSSPEMTRSPSLRDLLTILYRPGETMRRILDSGEHRWSVEVVVLAFACASVNDAYRLDEALPGLKLLPTLAIVALSIVVGAAAWVVTLFIMSWIATPIGRILGGTGTVADVRAALGWGMAPIVWSAIYRVPLAILMSEFHIGSQTNTRQVFLDFVAHGGCSIIILYLGFQLLFAIWSFVVGCFTLAEAHRFSAEKGFVNLAIAIALPLLVIASAVFTFRR